MLTQAHSVGLSLLLSECVQNSMMGGRCVLRFTDVDTGTRCRFRSFIVRMCAKFYDGWALCIEVYRCRQVTVSASMKRTASSPGVLPLSVLQLSIKSYSACKPNVLHCVGIGLRVLYLTF